MGAAKIRLAAMVAALLLAGTSPASAQVELRSILPEPLRNFDIVTPGPTARELTRPRDLEFYGEDQRVPYNPAFIEPLTTKSPGGTAKMGVSAWAAPYTPVGPLSGVNPYVGSGAFSLGFTVIWDIVPPDPVPGPPPAR